MHDACALCCAAEVIIAKVSVRGQSQDHSGGGRRTALGHHRRGHDAVVSAAEHNYY